MRAKPSQLLAFDHAVAELRLRGWYVFLTPILHIVDDTWVLRLRNDRLDHLFLSETGEWKRQRFTREPFGDYTVPYQDKGSGKDLASLIASLG
jgi:hypothetical protein